jgi:hypothetical protein
MNGFRLICLAAVAVQSVGSLAAASGAATNPEGNGSTATRLPPVLRPSEPPDSGQITLPGPAPITPAVAPAPKKVTVATPVAKVAPLPVKLVEDAVLRRPLPVPAAPAVVAKRPAPVLETGNEVAALCQKQIGHWKEIDARKLLGQPKRHRPAYDENKAVNGTIYAFDDPTSKYKELELDFDLKSGALRTVFVYPPRLTWQECRRVWNGPVAVADAAQGRKFYSYTNRHLDVLVDATGKVISLGWY